MSDCDHAIGNDCLCEEMGMYSESDLMGENKTINVLTKRIFTLNKTVAKLEKINKEQEKEMIRLWKKSNQKPEFSRANCSDPSGCYKPSVCESNGCCCAIDDIPF